MLINSTIMGRSLQGRPGSGKRGVTLHGVTLRGMRLPPERASVPPVGAIGRINGYGWSVQNNQLTVIAPNIGYSSWPSNSLPQNRWLNEASQCQLTEAGHGE